MSRTLYSLIAFLILMVMNIKLAQAEGLDEASQKAVEQTVDLLNDRQKRNKAVNENAAARKAHNDATSLAGSKENSDKIYKLTSMIFKRMANEEDGSAEKMQSIVNQALQNPEAFASQFTPEERKLLREISNSIEGKGSPKP